MLSHTASQSAKPVVVDRQVTLLPHEVTHWVGSALAVFQKTVDTTH